jgi:hypothetical protein
VPGKPPENPELVRALLNLEGGAAMARRSRVLGAVLKAELILVASGPPDPKQESGGVALVAMRTKDGRNVLPVFSHTRAMRACKPDANYCVTVPAPWVFKTAIERGFDLVVIDPGGSEWEIQPPEYEDLSKGRLPAWEPPRETAVRCEISPPGVLIAEEALSHVREVLHLMPEIKACWFFSLALGAEPPRLCLGLRLDLSDAQWREYISKLPGLGAVPGLEEPFSIRPVSDEMLAGVERFGLLVFKKG